MSRQNGVRRWRGKGRRAGCGGQAGELEEERADFWVSCVDAHTCTHIQTQRHARELAKQCLLKKNSEAEGSFVTSNMILNIIPCSRKLIRGGGNVHFLHFLKNS